MCEFKRENKRHIHINMKAIHLHIHTNTQTHTHTSHTTLFKRKRIQKAILQIILMNVLYKKNLYLIKAARQREC